MLKKILIITLIMVVGATLLFADVPFGREILDEGNAITVTGTLKYDTSEWYLKTKDGSYLLHFGNKTWLESTGIVLKDGEECSIKGISTEDDIVVSKATVDGKTYSFRDKDGIPLWAHKGNVHKGNVHKENVHKENAREGNQRGNGVYSRRMNSERENHRLDSQMYGRRGK